MGDSELRVRETMEVSADETQATNADGAIVVSQSAPGSTIAGEAVGSEVTSPRDSSLTATRAGGSSQPDSKISPGLPRIEGYEIEGELGRGGMGVVYRARQILLNRACALKVILAGGHADPIATVRFLGEAEAVAKLQHPNIIQIHHIGQAEGLPYLELEYLAGGSLDQALDGTPWPARRAARFVEGLARGIAHAHEAGIVHRDLKPGNILLAADGSPRIGDFGLAKSLESDSALTATGSILGTPSYMSPEQAEGKTRDIGPLADIYALGAILYELLVGRPPFRGTTPLETLEQVKHVEPVPPSRLLQGLPLDIETIALKCLQKEPLKRYASALDLAEDLRRFQSGESIVARPEGPIARAWRWCRRNRVVASLLGLLALAIVAGFAGVSTMWFRSEQQREDLRRQNAVTSVKLAIHDYEAANLASAERHLRDCPPDRRFFEWNLVKRLCHRDERTFDDHKWFVWGVDFSPGGDRIASVAGGYWYSLQPGQGELLVHDTATGNVVFEQRGLRHGLKAVAFDPASRGRYLATGGGLLYSKNNDQDRVSSIEGSLDLWDTETGERRTLDQVKDLCVIDVAYSPDGSVLAAAYGVWGNPGAKHGYARLWDVATGKPIGEPFSGRFGDVWCLSLSHDGQWLALSTKPDENDQYAVEVWDWRKRELAYPPFRTESRGDSLAFSPDGRFLACGQGWGLIQIWELSTGEESRRIQAHAENEPWGLAYTPDSNVLISGSEDRYVKLWDTATGKQLESLRGHPGYVLSLAVDREGHRMVSGDSRGQIKLWNLEHPRPLRFANSRGGVAFLPDGKGVIIFSSRNGASVPELWNLQSGQLLRTFQGLEENWNGLVALSQDGTVMATGRNDGTVRIWDLESGQQRAVLDHGKGVRLGDVVFDLRDNSRLVTSTIDGMLRLWKIDSTGKNPPTETVMARLGSVRAKLAVAVPDLALRPPSGLEIAAGLSDGSVHVWNLETQTEVQVISDLGAEVGAIDFSPDGKILAAANYLGLLRPGSVTLYDMETRTKFRTLSLPETVMTLAFNHDGTRLATASLDGTVRLWDPTNGRELLDIRSETAGFLLGGPLVFSPDGHHLFTGSSRGNVVWDASPWTSTGLEH